MRENPDSLPDSGERRSGFWPGPILLGMQTVGAVIFYAKGLSWYRDLVADSSGLDVSARPATWIWSLTVTLLIQFGYWTHWKRYRLLLETVHRPKPLAGHLVRFFARLVFILPSSVFSVVFINNELKGRLPITRYVLGLCTLFSLYCYTLGLNRWGKRLMSSTR